MTKRWWKLWCVTNFIGICTNEWFVNYHTNELFAAGGLWELLKRQHCASVIGGAVTVATFVCRCVRIDLYVHFSKWTMITQAFSHIPISLYWFCICHIECNVHCLFWGCDLSVVTQTLDVCTTVRVFCCNSHKTGYICTTVPKLWLK